jgi:hypothetical protein
MRMFDSGLTEMIGARGAVRQRNGSDGRTVAKGIKLEDGIYVIWVQRRGAEPSKSSAVLREGQLGTTSPVSDDVSIIV